MGCVNVKLSDEVRVSRKDQIVRRKSLIDSKPPQSSTIYPEERKSRNVLWIFIFSSVVLFTVTLIEFII